MSSGPTEGLVAFGLISTHIDTTLGGLFVSYLATRERISRLFETKWRGEDLTRHENKSRMKQVGGAGMQYMYFLKQSAILMLAKAIEDCFSDCEREAGKSLKFWQDADLFPHGQHAKEVRALANVIKHGQSIILARSSDSARFLVERRGYADDVSLDLLMLEDERAFDVPATITHIYSFLMEVAEYATGYRHAILSVPAAERLSALRAELVPEVLDL